MDLSIFFAGTAGSVPTARRGLPATLLRRGADKLLIDCGEGTQRQLIRSVGLPEVTEVFITHLHLDHWLGLPGMLKSFDLRDRALPLTVFGPPGTEALLDALRRTVFGRLKYRFKAVDLEPDAIVEFDGYEIHALRVRHRGEAYGYALIEADRPGRFDAALAERLGVTPGPDFGRLQRGETVDGVAPEQVMGQTRRGRRVVFSGDTAPCDMVRVAADGADVLVHEATFTSEERERALETGHSTARQAAELAAEAGVGLLALTHVSTRYMGREIRDEARAFFPRTEVPRDFDLIDVPFPEKGAPELHRWDPQRPSRDPAEADPARREQPPRLAGVVEQQRLVARVLGVEALDAVEARHREAPHRPQHLLGVRHVPEGMRPHGHAAGPVDDLDRLFDGRARARDVGGGARDEVGREQLAAPADALAREPLRVVRMGEYRVGEVRAPDALARGEGGVVECEAELAQAVGHRMDAPPAVRAEVLERRLQLWVRRVDLVAEDVQVLVLAVDARELGGGGEADAVLAGRRARLGHARDRVVIREREQLDAGGGGQGDDLRGGQRAVRVHRVRLKVEGGRVTRH